MGGWAGGREAGWQGAAVGGAGRGHWEGCDLVGEGMGGRNDIIYDRVISNDKLFFFNVI